MLSERRLKKWRRIALLDIKKHSQEYPEFGKMLSKIILELTQELLDAHLLRKK